MPADGLAKHGWTWRKAHYRPVIPRAKLFCKLCRETWHNRRSLGGTAYTLWTNFRLATWLGP